MLLISPWRTACCLPKLFNPKIFLVASPAKEAKLPINLPTASAPKAKPGPVTKLVMPVNKPAAIFFPILSESF